MNKSKDDDYKPKPYEIGETIVCPVCKKTSDIIKIDFISIDDVKVRLHEDVGDIWRCMNFDCLEYLIKVNDKYEPISRDDIMDKQSNITKFLAAELEAARVPSVVEAELAKVEAGRALSGILYNLTVGDMFDRAYTIEELLEACKALGLHPSNVYNDSIVYVVSWLRERKGENKI